MTMDAISIEIEELTPEQAAAIWSEQKKRPANYLEFVMYLRAKEIGAAFNVKVQPGDKNEEHARSIRKWFGEAAKERVRFEQRDGNTVEIPDPAAIKWKEDSHKEKRVVTKDGKRGEVEVKVIDRLHGKLVAADEVKPRGRGADDNTEQVDELVAAQGPFAAGSKSVPLNDGRVAKLTRSGHWRAPKLAQTPLPTEPTPRSARYSGINAGFVPTGAGAA